MRSDHYRYSIEVEACSQTKNSFASCKQGSQDAFGRLVNKYWASVVGTVLPLLGDPDDVEDAAQEAFIFLLGWQAVGIYRVIRELTAGSPS